MHRRDLFTLPVLAMPAFGLSGCSSAELTMPEAQTAGRARPLPWPLMTLTATLHRSTTARPGNTIWSPWSLGWALALVALGADGRTRSEFARVLGVSPEQARDALEWGLARIPRTSDKVGLEAAGRVVVRDDLSVQRSFRSDLEALSSPVGTFARGHQDDLVGELNDWVSEATKGAIGKLFADGAFNEQTTLVFVNALHLRTRWGHIAHEQTVTFHGRSGDRQVSGLAMSLGSTSSHVGRSTWTGISIPLADEDFHLVVGLPDRGSNPETVSVVELCALAGDSSKKLEDGMQVILPQWESRCRRSPKQALVDAGLVSAFDPTAARFGRMSTTHEPLFIQDIAHEAWIKVTEGGIEAAAATEIHVGDAAAPLPGDELVIDRPFLYAIVHAATATPLFVGRIDELS
ncbi:serpin family protein [Acidipropionibacterium timonense]|uniref:serpin family protein n=1 Tax=Acidipropionibacterium timonense TaxID=2161818 RepID=UPI001030101B|nr:serpin family protein [Acidipropionibacterium timonense]